ncbi:hypothetical protein PscP78CL_13735 [Pseudomonas syringae]|nr:hypothetical protein [Pseudomonas syringae]NAP20984.1 hypothetical protein [Pseudomonas syringae]NAP26721.1 hypothetical protein [Pseudomonas syringae]NAP50172.1 hypothetical protein [Pseudomonas syringae]NAP84984.1 hypothetical protein [Pseudomonas syringae]
MRFIPHPFFYACSIRSIPVLRPDGAVHRHRKADGHCKVLLTANYRDAAAARTA